MTSQVRKITFAASIAGVYFALTILLAPISYNALQFRVSEALTILPYFFPLAVPGLFVGCILANLFSPVNNLLDVVIGSTATLLAAICTMQIGKSRNNERLATKAIACIPPVVINAVLVGTMIAYVMLAEGDNAVFWENMIECILLVGFGQLVVLYVIGLPLMIYLPKMGVIDRLKNLYSGGK